jgi:hypothetical protein
MEGKFGVEATVVGKRRDKVIVGKTYGLPVSERRKDGGSVKSFPSNDGYEWLGKPSG